jgi:hypothetical protein
MLPSPNTSRAVISPISTILSPGFTWHVYGELSASTTSKSWARSVYTHRTTHRELHFLAMNSGWGRGELGTISRRIKRNLEISIDGSSETGLLINKERGYGFRRNSAGNLATLRADSHHRRCAGKVSARSHASPALPAFFLFFQSP